MITRKLGKILRGEATPFQMFSACVLATILGFMPGFVQAPGLIVFFTLLLVVLNANLALAALTGLAVKLLSLLLAPVTFAAGRFLLDGPTQPLFRKMINAPVLALFGFEYYLTTGGLALGLVVGCVIGLVGVKAITAFRKKMASLESGSEKFKAFNAKGWVKVLTFIFVGGKRKKSYEETLARKGSKPIRPLGVVFAVLVVVLLVLLQLFASGPIVTMVLQNGLEKANGATVDVKDAELNLKESRMVITGLAMADPNNLGTDLLRAGRLEAKISGVNLLKKRLQLDRVVISDASNGEKREVPGKLVGKPPAPPEAKPAEPNVKTIDDYLKDAKVWKERLAQVKRWLEKLSGPKSDQPTPPGEKKETLEERLAREIREKGYAHVQAGHLIEGAPTLTISELIAEKVRVAGLPGETIEVTATNLSTHPSLLGKVPEVVIRSSKDTLGADLRLGAFGQGSPPNLAAFHYHGLATDKIASSLKIGNQPPLQGGTMDVNANGNWVYTDGLTVDLPLQVQLHNTTLTLPGMAPTKVDNFLLPIGVRGQLDNPRISVDDKELANALVKAGVDRAKQALTEKATETISKEVGSKLGEQGKGLLNGLLGGKKEEKK
jgi:uncharacterized protein (TIGR03546 family)